MSVKSLLFLSLVVAAGPVLCAPPPAPLDHEEMLEETVVDADGSLTAPDLAESRAELRQVPGGTEVIDPARFLTGRASTPQDAFLLSPGLVVQSRHGSAEARLSARGSGLQRTYHGLGLGLLLDGMPLNQADGSFDMQALDLATLSHINVWRGGNALGRGMTSLGGAVDHISRTGLSHPGGSIRLETGSFGYFSGTLQSGFSDASRDLYLGFTQRQQSGFRRHSRYSDQHLTGNFGLRPREDLETRFYLGFTHTDLELSGPLTRSELASLPSLPDRSLFGASRYGWRHDYQLLRLANKTSLRRGDDTWSLGVGWTHKDMDHPLTPFVGVLDELSNQLFVGLEYSRAGLLLGRENHLRVMLHSTRGVTDSAQYLNALGRRGALREKNRKTASNLTLALENRHALIPGLNLTTAAALVRSTRQNSRRFQNPLAAPPFYFPPALGDLTSYKDHFTRVVPQLGLVWERGPLQYFTSLSGSFEPPSFGDIVTNNTARKAQRALTLELGTRGTHGPWRWDATLYSSKIRNELLEMTDPATLLTATTNAGQTRHRGLELGAEIDLLGNDWAEGPPVPRLVLRGAYTYGNFRFHHDPEYGNNRLAGLPPQLVRGELLWESPGGYYAGPTFECSPVKSFIDHRNSFAAAPYALLGFKLGRRQANGLSWFLEARNLANRRYAATHGVIADAGGTDQRQFYPGDGRSLYLGVEWSW